jgi:seryl-tRNA synthetase
MNSQKQHQKRNQTIKQLLAESIDRMDLKFRNKTISSTNSQVKNSVENEKNEIKQLLAVLQSI